MSTDTSKAEITINEGPDEGLLGALKADGLVTEGEVSIKYENGILTVNGAQVDAEKYKQHLKGEKMEINITKDKK
jgi:hypothetical protein